MSLDRPLATHAPSTTPAAVLRADEVSLERIDVPEVRAGELLVAVDLVTVCGADRAAAKERDGAPRVLGHEGVGRVLIAGDGADIAPGTRIVWGPIVSCGRCDRCRGGRSAACRKVRRLGEQPLDGPWPLSGSFARHLTLPRGTAVAAVPDGLCDAAAAPAGCAASTVMAALDAAGPLRGSRVIICGAGMLGVTAAAVANDRGASSIVVVDRDAARRTQARAFGATETLAPDTELPPADIALEFSGSVELASAALGALALGGRLVLVGARGAAQAGAPLGIDTRRAIAQWHTVAGVHGAEPRHLTEAVAYLADARDRWPWEQLVSPAMPMSYLPTLLTQPPPIAPRAAVQPRR